MDEKALFLKFWDKEAPATRKVMSRIPEGSTYRPDPKSRTAREIAWLIVREEIVLAEGLGNGKLEWVEVPTPATMREVLEDVHAHHDSLGARLRNLDAAKWEARVPFHVSRSDRDERDRIRQRVGLPARRDSPPRSALDVSAADGLDRAVDLRTER